MDWLLIATWTAAGLSLVAMIVLLAVPKRKKDPSGATLPASGLGNSLASSPAIELSTWKAPTQADLDGILKETFASAGGAGSRQRLKRKLKVPVTMQQRIIRAGIYRRGGMQTFHVVRVMLTICMLLSGCLIVPLTSLPWVFAAYIGAFAAVAGHLAPSFWLDKQLRNRQTKMRRALPDALDLITVCLQGGLSLPAALSRVARELGPAHPMLATELSIAEREIQMGRNTGGAMFQMAQRFDLEELRSLSSVIGQTEKYGGTIASALKNYAESLRIRRRQRAEEMAQKAAVKLLFPTLLCIFPGIFVVVLGPTAVRMYQVMSEISWSG